MTRAEKREKHEAAVAALAKKNAALAKREASMLPERLRERAEVWIEQDRYGPLPKDTTQAAVQKFIDSLTPEAMQ